MNINSYAVSAIVDSCSGWIGTARAVRCEASGCCGSDWKADGSLCFWIPLAVLWCVVCRSIDLSVCVAPMHLEQVKVFGAAASVLVKQKMKLIQ